MRLTNLARFSLNLALKPVAAGVSRVRLDIHPDGGLSRLRLMGEVTPPARERMGQRWLSLLGPAQAAAAEPEHFFS